MKKTLKQILIKVRNGGLITPAIFKIAKEVEKEKLNSYQEGLQEGIKDGYKNFQKWKKEEKEKWAEEIEYTLNVYGVDPQVMATIHNNLAL